MHQVYHTWCHCQHPSPHTHTHCHTSKLQLQTIFTELQTEVQKWTHFPSVNNCECGEAETETLELEVQMVNCSLGHASLTSVISIQLGHNPWHWKEKICFFKSPSVSGQKRWKDSQVRQYWNKLVHIWQEVEKLNITMCLLCVLFVR